VASVQRVARGKRVDASLDLLDALGLSPQAIEYFLGVAYESRRLPHDVVRELAEAHVKRASAVQAALLNTGRPS